MSKPVHPPKPPECRDDGFDTDPRCYPDPFDNPCFPLPTCPPGYPPGPSPQPTPGPGCQCEGKATDPPCCNPDPSPGPPPTPHPHPPTPPPTPVPPGPEPKPIPPPTPPPYVPPPHPHPPKPTPTPTPIPDPHFPEKNEKNPFPHVPNDELPNFGLPLVCFVETRLGREVFGCYDERGVRFEYRGPGHPNSTTTIFGNWTGPAPYANDLPVKVKGRQQAETSALDSFSLLYTILCYDYGFHVTEIDVEYAARIQAALALGVISPFKQSSEFDSAMRILRSFQRTGHIFDVVNAFGETEYATRLGGVPKDAKWIKKNAEMSYPTFDFSPYEMSKLQQTIDLNPDADVTDIDSLLRLMEAADLRTSYPFIWLTQRRYNALQGEYAFQHIKNQLNVMVPSTSAFPQWHKQEKNDPFKQIQSAVTFQSLTNDLTASIFESLL